MPKDLEAVVRAAKMQNTEPKLSYNKTAKTKWNLYKHEKSKQKVKSSPTEYTAPYFVSHLDSMSSNELTSHLHSFHVSFTFMEPMQIVSSPLPSSSLFLSFWLNLLSEPMHVCNPAHVWTLQRLAIWSTFWLPTTFLSFWNLCKSSSRPCFPVPYGPMQRLCHPAHFFSFVVSQNSFNSIKIANLKSQIPSFCFSLWATRQRKTTLPFYSSLRILCKVW